MNRKSQVRLRDSSDSEDSDSSLSYEPAPSIVSVAIDLDFLRDAKYPVTLPDIPLESCLNSHLSIETMMHCDPPEE
jgi:hypothetical protein